MKANDLTAHTNNYTTTAISLVIAVLTLGCISHLCLPFWIGNNLIYLN